MRCYFLAISVLLFGCIDATAQSIFNIGAIAGVTTSQIEGDGYGGFNKVGPLVGGFVNTDIGKVWKVQFEITYVNKGSKDPANPKSGNYNFRRINMHYVEVPVLGRYYFAKRKMSFELGLTYGRLTAIRYADANGQIPALIPSVKKNEFGYLAGASVTFVKNLSLNWRYQSSFLPIAEKVEPNPYWRFGFVGGTYNIGIVFSLRYQIPINSKNDERT